MADGNALIPLMGEPVDLGRSVLSGAVAGNQLMQFAENSRNAPLRQREAQIAVESGNIKLNQEKALDQLRSAAIDGSYIRQDLASGDMKTAISRLEQRNKRLMAEGRDNTHTQHWLSALYSGDPARVQGVAQEMAEIDRAYQQFGGGTQAQPSYGQPVEVIGPDGKPMLVQFDKSGNRLAADGYTPAPKADAGPSYGQPVAGIGPDGKPAFMRFDNNSTAGTTVPGFSPAPKSSMSLTTNADGTMSFSTGGQGGGVTSSTSSKIEQSILGNDQAMQHLNEIEALYKPEYLTYAAKLGAGISQIKAKLGKLDPNSPEAKALIGYSTFAAASGDYFAKTLKEMSGGAVTPEEGKRQEKWIPNADDDHVTFKSKTDRSITFIKSANARLHYARAHGLSPEQMYGVPIDTMPQLVNARAAELEAQGLDEALVEEQLRKEFGV